MAKKVKGTVDIVVLMDITGSMQTCIDAVKQSVSTFVNSMTTKDANNSAPIQDWRLKVVGYRDYDKDPGTWFVDNPFVRDVAAVQAQLAAPNMQAEGGGDESESLLDAIYKVSTMGEAGIQDGEDPNRWRTRGSCARALIFFTDATFRRTMSLPEAAGGGIGDVIAKISSSKIILCGFQPEWEGYNELGTADKATLVTVAKLSDTPALAGLGKPGPEGIAAQVAAVNAMSAKASDATAFTKIMEQLAKTVVKSVTVEVA